MRINRASIIITPKGDDGVDINFDFDPPNRDEFSEEDLNSDPVWKTLGLIVQYLEGRGATSEGNE